MEIRNILTFLKVAGTQNFSKAAEQLGYSQSAVTIQIQQLEKELGTQLFERIGKRVYLTEKGQEFIGYASEIMRVTNEALTFAGEEHTTRGTLKIGGVESTCTALLPELLLQYHRLYPEVEVIIKSGATENLMDLAKSDEIDLIFTLDKKIYSSQWMCAAERVEDTIFVTSDRVFAQKSNIHLIQHLAKAAFLLTETGAAYRYELEQMLAEKEIEIVPVLEIGNTETIINLLKRGMGISFLPEFTVKEEIEKGVLFEIRTDLPGVKMCKHIKLFSGYIFMHGFCEIVVDRHFFRCNISGRSIDQHWNAVDQCGAG